MNLDDAYAITSKMTEEEDRSPTTAQREAKNYIYENVILKRYGKAENVPSHLEPDYLDGWRVKWDE